MLRRVKISGYKSLRNVDVCLEPLSVLFGPNAAGKSNFLDALQLLSRMATSNTLAKAFEPPYRGTPLESFTFGPDGLNGLMKQETASFCIEADVELSPAVVESVDRQVRERRRGLAEETEPPGSVVRERRLRYRIEVDVRPKSGILQVADEYLAALGTDGEPSRRRRPFLELDASDNRLHLRMERQAHPTYHDRYLDHTILSMPLYPPHHPHMVAMREELASWLFFYFEPRERMRAPNPVREVRHIGMMGENLAAFLNTLRAVDERQYEAVEKALHMLIPSASGIDVSVNSFGLVELGLLEGDAPMPARILSEGTLRMLGLLAQSGIKDSPGLLGFEEPENGIHPRRIRLVAETLRNRASVGGAQVLATSHSPIFLDLIPDESLYACRKRQGATSIEPFQTLGPLARDKDVAKGLDDDEEPATVSERIMRGDFDA